MNNINEVSNEKCVGCCGCAAACPCEAIDLKLDADGFIVATANDKCIDCGKCKAVCFKFFKEEDSCFPEVKAVYAGYNRNLTVRYPSSSGGIATALAKTALGQGYAVAGAYLDMEKKELRHIILTDEKELPLIRGSKYIPSFTDEAFQKIGKYDKVLYIGTPCQVYSLRKLYPRKDILYVDFRCAGTAGYTLFNKYADYLERMNSSGIANINFRAKNRSWHIWGVETTFKDGKTFFRDKYHDLFGKCFSVYADCVHNVCRSCRFINDSMADIRIEDAWHQMQYVKKNDYHNGYSQIAVFTQRGEELLKAAEPLLSMRPVEDDFHGHTRRERKGQSALFYRIRNDSTPLEQTVREYEKSIPLLKRVTNYLSYLASINLYLYRILRYAYKNIIKRRG